MIFDFDVKRFLKLITHLYESVAQPALIAKDTLPPPLIEGVNLRLEGWLYRGEDFRSSRENHLDTKYFLF